MKPSYKPLQCGTQTYGRTSICVAVLVFSTTRIVRTPVIRVCFIGARGAVEGWASVEWVCVD